MEPFSRALQSYNCFADYEKAGVSVKIEYHSNLSVRDKTDWSTYKEIIDWLLEADAYFILSHMRQGFKGWRQPIASLEEQLHTAPRIHIAPALFCSPYRYSLLASCLAVVSHLIISRPSLWLRASCLTLFCVILRHAHLLLSPIEFFKVYVIVLSTVVLISYTEFLDSNILTGNVYNVLNVLSFNSIEKYTFQFIMIDLFI